MTRTIPVMLLYAVLLCSVLLAPVTGQASTDLLQPIGEFAVMDWGRMRLSATGQGFPPAAQGNLKLARTMAERAALLDARRNLVEALMAVRVDSVTTVRNFITENDVAVSRINGVLHRNVTEELRPLENWGVRARVSIPITGDLARELFAKLPGRGPSTAQEPPPPSTPSYELRSRVSRDLAAPPYTGLIIDARGLGFEPVLRPRILGPDGALYPVNIPPESAALRGYAAYFLTPEEASDSGRLGDSPLLVPAERIGDASQGDLMLPEERATVLRRIMEQPGNFLENCRVAIII